MLSVTKIFEFAYGHCLPNHPGLCKNFHGHNCKLEVEFARGYVVQQRDDSTRLTFESDSTNNDGMVVDFGDIKKILQPTIEQLDHQNLNEVMSQLYFPPTAENMCLFFRDHINAKLLAMYPNGTPLRLIRVRCYETSTSYAEWKMDL
jgi:6-pyruvoyltetrahydropterin/6-carboxytetrahydropterin synthase